MVVLLLGLHATGYDVALVFFAVATALVAGLLRQGRLSPRWLSLALAAAALVYLAGGLVRLVAPGLSAALAPAYLVPLLAESTFALWLTLSWVTAQGCGGTMGRNDPSYANGTRRMGCFNPSSPADPGA